MESPSVEQRSVLETMTEGMKLYKLILHRLESQNKLELYEDYKGTAAIQQNISDFQKLTGLIEFSHCTQILNNRLVNRYLEITTMYTNKLPQSPWAIGLKGHMNAILILIREYQTSHALVSPLLNNSTLRAVTRISPNDLLDLFDKICCVLKKCVKELRQKVLRANPILVASINIQEGSTVKDKEKERKMPAEVLAAKSLPQKFKKPKDPILNTNIFAGMDLDISYLKGLCQNITHNLEELQDQKIEANQGALKARDFFVLSFNKWKLKSKRKSMRKDRVFQCNPVSPPKSKALTYENKPQDVSMSMMKTMGIPKALEEESLCREFCGEGEKKRRQFKNMQVLTYNRQFIHLSEIKNQKIAKRPYAEVKQVLVAGDELNYYSNKYCHTPFEQASSKTPFFLQRAVKNQNAGLRKRPYLENCRIATSE